VDLTEAVQRILRRHWFLLVLMTAIGVSVPAALIRMEDPSYLATARIVIGAADTNDGQEATALADTALALATSQEVVGRALERAEVQANPAVVVEQVQVESVGTSGVLELSVVDPDARTSAAVVNAVATEIVRMRDEAIVAPIREVLAQTDAQIAELTARIGNIERAAGETVARWGSVEALALQHAQAMEQQSALENQRQALLQTLAAAVRPRVVDTSATSGVLVPPALTTRLAIGGLLGLVLGVALAATWESLRPTLRGAAIARYLGAPLLARLRPARRTGTGTSDPWLANYLTLAADAAGVTTVQLIPVGRRLDVSTLAEDLDDREGGPKVVSLVLDHKGPPDSIDPLLPGERAGIVAVTPDVVKGTAAFADLERHAELAHRPIIGVITCRGRAGRRPSASRAPARPAASEDVDELDATPSAS
jgi:capsular polysaccharide biosynthesis protein